MVDSINARPNYSSTKKWTMAGAGISAVGAVSDYILMNKSANTVDELIKNSEEFNGLCEGLKNEAGLDLKEGAKRLKSKSVRAKVCLKNLAVCTAAFAGIGLAIDLVKNHKAKKAQRAEKV